MGKDLYYEYDVIVYEDGVENIRRGVICADSFGTAADELDDFYGDELGRINKLACITDGIYEFNHPETEFKIHVEA